MPSIDGRSEAQPGWGSVVSAQSHFGPHPDRCAIVPPHAGEGEDTRHRSCAANGCGKGGRSVRALARMSRLSPG